MATELQQANREDPSWPSFKPLNSNDIHTLPHVVSMNRPLSRCRYCKNPAAITAEPGVILQKEMLRIYLVNVLTLDVQLQIMLTTRALKEHWTKRVTSARLNELNK